MWIQKVGEKFFKRIKSPSIFVVSNDKYFQQAMRMELTMEALSKKIDRLELKHLQIMVKTMAERYSADADFIKYGLSDDILRFFFGNDWTNANVSKCHDSVSRKMVKGRQFFKTDSPGAHDQFRHMQRVLTLAEVVFNMQGINGLKQKISNMHNHELESALGELECAALLSSPELEFRFVTPSGIKGRDYDGEITTHCKRMVPCEIETKVEATCLTENTLSHTLDHARKQLPKDNPGLILLKIPEPWVKQLSIESVFANCITRFFRQTQRVMAIIVTWEEYYGMQGQETVNKIKILKNDHNGLCGDDINVLLSKIGRSKNTSWIQLHEFVEGELRNLNRL